MLKPSKELSISSAAREVLVALIECGPLWDGDVPCKSGRDELLDLSLAVRVVVKLEDGWQAATYTGRDLYKLLYPGPDGPASTMQDARINRLSARVIRSAQRK